MPISSVGSAVVRPAVTDLEDVAPEGTGELVTLPPELERYVTCIMPPLREYGTDGPTGSVRTGDVTYLVENGQVTLNGKNIGTCDDTGHYDVTIDGQKNTGNVGDLVGAAIEGRLGNGGWVDNRISTGEVQIGNETYDLWYGQVRHDGETIGSMNAEGEFDVNLNGDHLTGNIHDVKGATYDYAPIDGDRTTNRPIDGRIEWGARSFSVDRGVVLAADGSRMGTINDEGEFDVMLDGKRETGNLQDVHGVVFHGWTSNLQEVEAKGPTGNVSAAKLGLASLEYGNFGDVSPGRTSSAMGHVEVYDGQIFHDGLDAKGNAFHVRIGTMNDEGEFLITVDGRDYRGVYDGGFRSF